MVGKERGEWLAVLFYTAHLVYLEEAGGDVAIARSLVELLEANAHGLTLFLSLTSSLPRLQQFAFIHPSLALWGPLTQEAH